MPTGLIIHISWTIERFVEEIVSIRKTLEIEKVHILGQSWGSVLAVITCLPESPKG